MPFSDSPLAYDDLKGLLDKALMTEKGLRVRFETYGKAVQFRHKLNHFRKIDRRESTKIYMKGDPLFGKTIYDKLEFRVHGDEERGAIDILKREAIQFDIIELD